MNAQEIKIIVEDEKIVEPESLVIKINSISDHIFKKGWLENTNFISRDSVLRIIEQTDNINRIERQKSTEDISIEDYLIADYIEVVGVNSYKELRDKLSNKIPFNIEETKLSNIKEYEENLINELINKSKIKAQSIVNKKGKNLGEMIKYTELDKPNRIEENKQDSDAKDLIGFGSLRQKFVFDQFDALNHNGYNLSYDGEIIIKKKIEVTWEIK